jgi:hypothetical protein
MWQQSGELMRNWLFMASSQFACALYVITQGIAGG